jgi:hypothetical protein
VYGKLNGLAQLHSPFDSLRRQQERKNMRIDHLYDPKSCEQVDLLFADA